MDCPTAPMEAPPIVQAMIVTAGFLLGSIICLFLLGVLIFMLWGGWNMARDAWNSRKKRY